MRRQRIAAGGIVLTEGRVLLVRYPRSDGGSFLVGPGGGLEPGEDALQAVVREVREETGVTVAPGPVLAVEELECSRFRMSKIWFLCAVVRGEPERTAGARAEGIIEARRFAPEELTGETVYPSFLTEHPWDRFGLPGWQVQCLPPRVADF